MKKRILLIVICLFGFINGVSAKTMACTSKQVEEARATLNYTSKYVIPIQTLGRTAATGHAYLYTMNLTNNSNGLKRTSYCLNSGLSAPQNSIYRVKQQVTDENWLKAYQYGVKNKGNFIKNAVAQAALWLLSEGKSLGNGTALNFNDIASIESNNLFMVASDIYLTTNCETLLNTAGLSASEATSKCESYKTTSLYPSTLIQRELFNRSKEKDSTLTINKFLSNFYGGNIQPAYMDFFTSSPYSGKLYIWENVDNPSGYQKMLAPLECNDDDGDEIESGKYTCTDSFGNVHDYTDDYNDCVLKGENTDVCKTKFESKYCSDSPYGIIVRYGTSAVCTNDSINYGEYYEEVDTTIDGNAIPGKGEPEKVVGSYCNLFCLENSAQQIFPGNVRPAVSSGTYIIWPTSEYTLSSVYKNQYPLKFSGQKTCYVVMSGDGNPVNNTDIDGVYNSLIKAAKDSNKYGTLAGRYYESSRVNGGCDNIYSNTTGVCKTSYNNMINAETELNNYKNSTEYKNALAEQQAVENNNRNLCSHDYASHKKGGISCTGDYCTEIEYFCSDPTSSTCDIIKKQCEQQKASGCTVGEAKTLSSGSQAAINKYNSLNAKYENAKTVYNSCQSEKNACNDYTNKVNKVIEFSNEVKRCATYTPSCAGNSCDIYDFTTNVDLSWGDSEYGRTIYDSELYKYSNYSYNIEGNQYIASVDKSQSFNNIQNATKNLITQVKNVVENRKIIANVSVTYSLPTSGSLLYNYVVKRDDSYVSQTAMPSSDSNYTIIGFSNLPISFNASTATLYNLTLSNIRFGDNGGQYTPSNYVCNYEVTKTLPTNCVCPVGTVYEGKDLSSFIIDSGKTCYEAQNAYCDVSRTSCPDDGSIDLTSCLESYDYFACYDMYCRNDSSSTKYCPDKPEINLSACLNNYDYNYCYNLLCVDSSGTTPGGTSGYKCKNTNGVDGAMDITSCVYTKMAQGLSLNDAINECDALIYPLSGLRIIYRTISLENPFPGKNISDKVLGFNDDVKGRYPGTNWNDLNLVRNHILTSRGYDGSTIYQQEPLYTFVLTTQTINAIREYNEQQELEGGYADYTLDCKLNNSRACVSDFVHNPDLSGLISGVCSSSTSRSNFYVCSGDK